MVQYVRGRGKQFGDPPKPVHTQGSLFGNGQEGARSNQVSYPLANPQTYCQRKTGACLSTDVCKSGTCTNLSPTVRRSRSERAHEDEQRAKERFAKTRAGGVYGGANIDNAERAAAGDTQRSMPRASASKVERGPLPPACHLSHPPYPVADGYTVFGGSGIWPHMKDCDVYCSLDRSGATSMPWDTTALRFVWEIKNYGVPSDVLGFKQLVSYLAMQIKAGKKVHIGCMAGHGRTGMVLAALRFEMSGDADAIMHVRNNYCDQAVETDAQVKWLMTNYGMNTAPPRTKRHATPMPETSGPIRKGDWGTPVDPYGPAPSFEQRSARQNSWAANSPWLIALEGPDAELEDEAAWYDDVQ